jgi:hypothetical protein
MTLQLRLLHELGFKRAAGTSRTRTNPGIDEADRLTKARRSPLPSRYERAIDIKFTNRNMKLWLK